MNSRTCKTYNEKNIIVKKNLIIRSVTPRKRPLSPKREVMRHSETPVAARKSEKNRKDFPERKHSSESR